MEKMILLLPILVPAAGALIAAPLHRKLSGRAELQGYVTFFLVLTGLLGVLALSRGGRIEFEITRYLTILFKIDRISILFCLLVAFMWPVAGVFSFAYLEHDSRRVSFYVFYLLTEGALMALAFAGNYMTMYMAFEFMSMLSFPLILHSRTKEAIVAAQKYLFYSIFGACLGLLGFFYMAAYQDTTEFLPGGSLNLQLLGEHRGLFLVILLLAILGFGTKAGMFPMHAWLPTAHPAAPAPASAVMSGVITKCGILAVVRIVFYEVGAEFLRGSWVQTVWMVLALITIFMGSMLAYQEQGLKKRLAYSSVSQLSYIMFGLSTMTGAGVTGALLHVVFHSVIKDLLFLCGGAVIHQTGITEVSELRSIGKQMPVTMGCFTVAALGLTGIPPTAGFVSKWYLAQGSLADGAGILSWLGPVVLLVSALLTAGYLLVISMRAFLPGEAYLRDYYLDEDSDGTAGEGESAQSVWHCDPDWRMLGPILLLAVLTVALGIFASPLYQFAARAAASVL